MIVAVVLPGPVLGAHSQELKLGDFVCSEEKLVVAKRLIRDLEELEKLVLIPQD